MLFSALRSVLRRWLNAALTRIINFLLLFMLKTKKIMIFPTLLGKDPLLSAVHSDRKDVSFAL